MIYIILVIILFLLGLVTCFVPRIDLDEYKKRKEDLDEIIKNVNEL